MYIFCSFNQIMWTISLCIKKHNVGIICFASETIRATNNKVTKFCVAIKLLRIFKLLSTSSFL